MPWLQRYVIGGFRIYAAISVFSAILFLCQKDTQRSVEDLLFKEDGWAALVVINFCILITGFLLHAIGRFIFGRLSSREWSNEGFTEQLNTWIIYRFIFLIGVLDINSLRTFLWWIWWFVIFIYLKFYVSAAVKRLTALQSLENTGLNHYRNRIYRVIIFLSVMLFINTFVISASVSTVIFGDIDQDYLFRSFTDQETTINQEQLSVQNFPRYRFKLIRRIFQEFRYFFSCILDLIGVDEHDAIVGPKLKTYISKLNKRYDEDMYGLIQVVLFTLGDTAGLFVENFYMLAKHVIFVLDEKLHIERRRSFYFNHWLTYISEQAMFWIALIHNSHLLYCCRFFSIPTLLYFYQIRTTWTALVSSQQKHKEFRYLRKQIVKVCKKLEPKQLQSQENCAICWEKFDATCRQLNCSHIFHLHCIQQWIEREKTCPTCRYDLLKNKTAHQVREEDGSSGRSGSSDENSDESESSTSGATDSEDSNELQQTRRHVQRRETRIQGNFLGMRFGISYSFSNQNPRQEADDISTSTDTSDYLDIHVEDREQRENSRSQRDSVTFTREIEEKILQVLEILPDVDRDRISTVLRLNGGQVNATINYLLQE